MERRCCRILVVAAVGLFTVAAVLALVFGLLYGPPPAGFESTFLARCKQFKGYDCQHIWRTFRGAYVGRNPCEVPVENYDPLITAVPFTPACNRIMLWSKTKDVVHDFTKRNSCFITLEDTLLGSVLNNQIWCGKEGSSETFTTNCPDCVNNPVRSFWTRASAAFADVACGDVTAMLNGSISTPFHPSSTFASIEVKRLTFPRTRSLIVVLVTEKNSGTNCMNASLKNLQKELDAGINYNCKEVAESQIQECGRNPEKPCGPCW